MLHMQKPPSQAALRRAFARTVRSLREQVPIAQERLALEANVNRRYMGALESGLHSPTLETIFKLLPPLKVSFVAFAVELERELAHRAPGNHPR